MRTRICIMLVTATALMVAQPGSAEAGTTSAGPFTYITRSVGVDPNSGNAVGTPCPSSRATGAGAAVGAAYGQAWIEGAGPMPPPLQPGSTPDYGAYASAWNADTQSRTVKLTAICMKGATASQLSYATRSGTTASGDSGFGSGVVCDLGYPVVLGGGFGIEPDASYSVVGSEPQPDASSWLYGFAGDGTGPAGKQWSGTVVCLPDGARDVRFIDSGPRPIPSGRDLQVTVHCPGRYHVASGGVWGSTKLLKSMPIDGPDADHAPDDGWVGKAHNPVNGAEIDLTVRALCVR